MKKVNKPWGHEIIFAETNSYIGKVLVIEKGERLSLQYHDQKDETIYVAEGLLEVIFNEKTFNLKAGENLHIPPKTKHRLIALEKTLVFEVSSPHANDLIRLEDHYGRI
ncbi:MAG: cupin domain-containing protein [Deltaproteobacteria bacterium]|nr:cupin domain-containing protein [Deltaproteobacteria bacterium]